VYAMCWHGEKVDQMETEIGKMKHGFNEVVWECQTTAYVIIDTLTNDIHDRLKAAKDTLIVVTQRLKDQYDTITLLKRALDNRHSSVVMSMRIKIKEPDPYDSTCNANFLGNFCWDIEQCLE